ncbi:hypothetical protein CRG98_037476 [Punica granatum]|uniref:Uncharacterized protein n=1 Tax=Punica granatum TaxID=22663 RepID=A0A2I0IDQ1_PUNGR|nr:hypothetical protein CRG98_037476 [Punica granatum]
MLLGVGRHFLARKNKHAFSTGLTKQNSKARRNRNERSVITIAGTKPGFFSKSLTASSTRASNQRRFLFISFSSPPLCGLTRCTNRLVPPSPTSRSLQAATSHHSESRQASHLASSSRHSTRPLTGRPTPFAPPLSHRPSSHSPRHNIPTIRGVGVLTLIALVGLKVEIREEETVTTQVESGEVSALPIWTFHARNDPNQGKEAALDPCRAKGPLSHNLGGVTKSPMAFYGSRGGLPSIQLRFPLFSHVIYEICTDSDHEDHGGPTEPKGLSVILDRASLAREDLSRSPCRESFSRIKTIED